MRTAFRAATATAAVPLAAPAFAGQAHHAPGFPSRSAHATADGPGAVGAFESTLAQSSDPIWACLP